MRIMLVPLISTALLLAATTSAQSDPCVPIAGKKFAAPADVLACQKSFPFNETIRENVLAVMNGCVAHRCALDEYV